MGRGAHGCLRGAGGGRLPLTQSPEPHTQQGLVFPFAEGSGLPHARMQRSAAPPRWTFIHPFNKVIQQRLLNTYHVPGSGRGG